MATYLFFDVETNGIGEFRKEKGELQTLTQLAFIKTDQDGNVIKTYQSLVKGATAVRDIPQVKFTVEQLERDGISREEVVKEFIESIDPTTILIAHNAEFDIGIMDFTAKSVGLELPNNIVVCTMMNSINICKTVWLPWKNDWKYPKLLDLANKMGIEFDEQKAHDALYDVDITRRCFFELAKSVVYETIN